VSDLRDQLAAFEDAARRILQPRPQLTLVHAKPASCHPGRPFCARGLCRQCYQLAWLRDALPDKRAQRPRVDFVADYKLLRSEGYTRRQIAERLRMTYDGVTSAYRRAVKAGDLTPDRRTA
jgi:hypothetical protein